MKKKLLTTVLFLALIMTTSCGGGIFTSPTNWGLFSISDGTFSLGSAYPADLVIPDIDGMRNTAFIVSTSAPCGVLAVDLESNPPIVSRDFKGLICPEGTGMFPYRLFILDATRAFMITESHLIDFNPTSGEVHTSLDLSGTHELLIPQPISGEYDLDDDGTPDTETTSITMNGPSDLTVAGGKLLVTMYNAITYGLSAVYAPGIIRVFDIASDPDFLVENTDPIITNDFNPTGITTLSDGRVIVTNSGVTHYDEVTFIANPVTISSIDILNPDVTKFLDNIPMGIVYLTTNKLVPNLDETIGYIGSSTYGELYAVDLVNYEAIYTHDNPVTITGNDIASDYLPSAAITHDGQYLFVASSDYSSIYPVGLEDAPPEVTPTAFPDPFQVGFPRGVTEENPTGVNTGVGQIAVRPGAPGADFTGPDLYVLTGSPGSLVGIQTYTIEETEE